MTVYRQKTDGDPEGSVTEALVSVAGALEAEVIIAPFRLAGREEAFAQVRKVSPDLPPVAFLDPVYPFSISALLARMTRSSKTSSKAMAVLRPCDHRALVELAKLEQISLPMVTTVVWECPGTVQARDAQQLDASSRKELSRKMAVPRSSGEKLFALRDACRACIHFDSPGADLQILWKGSDPWEEIYWETKGPVVAQGLQSAGLASRELPEERKVELRLWRTERSAFREERIQRFRRLYRGPEGLERALGACLGCMNCRQVCPLCYCRTCVFQGPDLETSWETVATWLKGRNALRLPVDTLLYHLVRMNHMGHGCVGCGLCGQACPMDVPVDLLFLAGGQIIQEVLGYRPGEKPDDPPPQGTFREDEFQELGR
jgi:formate dehydrogenase subunit beta